MKHRIWRTALALILVCCLLVNVSPLRANAMTGIIEGSVVSGNPAIILGAVIIALGLQVAKDAGVFENLANSAVNAMETAGGWIKDGAIELIKTVDETGRATYYAAGELFEAVRSWAFETGVVNVTETRLSDTQAFNVALDLAMGYPYWIVAESTPGSYRCWGSTTPFTWGYEDNNLYLYVGTEPAYQYHGETKTYRAPGTKWIVANVHTSAVTTSVTSSYDLELGNVPMSYIDGTSALAWAPEYANRQLRVIEGGGGNSGGDQSGDTGDQKWKWYLPISMAATLAGVAASNQQVQHSGVTPSDFDDTTPVRDLDIIGTPNIDGLPGLEINPSTNPNPGTNPDPGTNPGTNPDPGTDWKDWLTPNGDPGQYGIQLRDFFPFCIPFDLYDFLSCLAADPVAPVFHWEIPVPQLGQTFEVDVDLSAWDSVAELFRRLELLAFIVGLAYVTREKYLRG